MKTLYDVQQLLKRYGTYVHVGRRIWDIELMSIELKKMYDQQILSKEDYIEAQLVLKKEHHYEEQQERKHNDK
ncbi:YqgQ family protein [Lactobacillus sp. YT155]|uniref:YqgQ family protein n=1 Tax=Lactobacillus sp. YT155 TaxID=3060955 RepID=UPI00265E6053|nr:YqgQ family protein [Lactobacillus sp. YT155]MDO1605575.1 YqgQ family protein [Lactobacillus sp. YT155]